MTDSKPSRGRSQLLIIAAVFLGPLLVAAWLYFKGDMVQPQSRTNHGALLEPIVNLDDALPTSSIRDLHAEQWLLLFEEQGECAAPCRDGLFTTRQLRLMLGKEMDRVGRIFLHGETAPDTVFLADEHEGLIALEDKALSDLLNEKKPAALKTGGYYLIDPYGNLVMYFPPDLAPREIISDLKRLLKLSRIG